MCLVIQAPARSPGTGVYFMMCWVCTDLLELSDSQQKSEAYMSDAPQPESSSSELSLKAQVLS